MKLLRVEMISMEEAGIIHVGGKKEADCLGYCCSD